MKPDWRQSKSEKSRNAQQRTHVIGFLEGELCGEKTAQAPLALALHRRLAHGNVRACSWWWRCNENPAVDSTKTAANTPAGTEAEGQDTAPHTFISKRYSVSPCHASILIGASDCSFSGS